MMNLKPEELLQLKACPAKYQGNAALLSNPVAGFSIDSRSIQPNEVFVAIKGDRLDGHQFVPKVTENAEQICVVSGRWVERQIDLEGNFIVVDDTLKALQEFSHYYRMKFDIPVVALTGSNGKTTTKEMVAAVLEERYSVHKNKGNLNNHIGVPLSLLDLEANHTLAVIEMGTNHFGEIARLAEIAAPTHGLITNVGPAHLEFFGSLKGVSKAKRELWDYLEKNGQTAFVNVDDPNLRENIPAVDKIVTFGFEHPAQVRGIFTGMNEEGKPGFQVSNMNINLGIAGMHNIYNALAAVAVGLEFDLNMNQMKTALERFLPSAKRMEIVRKEGLVIINDCYNSNPESARKALQTLSQMDTKGQRIAVLADMLELGEWAEREHRAIGEFVVSMHNINHLLTFGPLSELTSKAAFQSGLKSAMHFNDKDSLFKQLKKIMGDNDLVLIKGSRGMEMEYITTNISG